MKEIVNLALIGDVMLGRGVNQEIPYRPPESFWGSTLTLLCAADAVIANLECTITEQTKQWQRTPKLFHFRADPAAVQVLRAANIRWVSLANNHTLDFEEKGLLDTVQSLDEANIHHAGAGRNHHEAVKPTLMDIAGLKVGLIALTDNEPPFAAGPDHPGTYYLEIHTDSLTLARIQSLVDLLHQEGAELIILSAHWGPNMVLSPPPQFRSFAHAVIDCGVDLFYGHSAHLCQGVEVYQQGLILYNTGDFLDDYAVDPILRNDWSFIFLVEIDTRGLRRLRMFPVCLRYARVDLAKGAEFIAIRQRMQSLCAPFNTPVSETSEGLEVLLRQRMKPLKRI
jgi:poly-gamma-glutamate capsule biosynthesis protein CapA/YwtB (metallophosphatase superfamily)